MKSKAFRVTRRGALKGALATGVYGSLLAPATASAALNASHSKQSPLSPKTGSTLTFPELTRNLDEKHHVAEGYRAQTLIRWGDPLFKNTPHFKPDQDADSQALQFGFGNDYIAYIPLDDTSESNHGLLSINHEHTVTDLMFPPSVDGKLTPEQIRTEMAAHGLSVIEVKKDANGQWHYLQESSYNRRITQNTVMQVTGPAAGHPLLQTAQDPTGSKVLGTLSNCAGGMTPWGTVLTCEENFDEYFEGDLSNPELDPVVKQNHEKYGLPNPEYSWSDAEERFDLSKHPNEPFRFGWVVEIDPMSPDSVPKKRTALGRFKHEGATVVVNSDQRIVVYSCDDEYFQYLYKFVSEGIYDVQVREKNLDLLDEGELYVAKFHEDGKLEWLSLQQGQGPLIEKNGFRSQADVVINARTAADLMGATPLDRPEGVGIHPFTGKVYISLTKNPKRKPHQTDASNPRANNTFGHILELIPSTSQGHVDHTASEAQWNTFVLGGDPRNPSHRAYSHPGVSKYGWIQSPDNLTFDPQGHLWIATDQGSLQHKSGSADGLFACDTEGFGRGLTRLFFQVPIGAEATGPCFTPDGKTLFVSVQHPGEGSTYHTPSTRWPDFESKSLPRSAVLAITHKDSKLIGT